MILSLEEINDPRQFESLVHLFFIKEKGSGRKDIKNITVKKTGIGPDEGSDILLEFLVTDGIKDFVRKWVVQCKFINQNVSPAHLSDNNIPSLIHSFGANGYLLICKKEPTAKLSKLFERLNEKCTFSYFYEIWRADQFCFNIETQNDSVILKKFFPDYFSFINNRE